MFKTLTARIRCIRFGHTWMPLHTDEDCIHLVCADCDKVSDYDLPELELGQVVRLLNINREEN